MGVSSIPSIEVMNHVFTHYEDGLNKVKHGLNKVKPKNGVCDSFVPADLCHMRMYGSDH